MSRIAYIGIPADVLSFCRFNDFMRFDIFSGFKSLRSSLLCIVGELAGGGSVAVAVGVSDR